MLGPPQTLAHGVRRPLEDCTGATSNPASVNTDDGYPTIVDEMANNYPEFLTQYTGNWYFQLMYANPYPYSVGPYYGPTYHTASFNWNCALAAIGSAMSAASAIAQRIVSNPSAYGAAATNVASFTVITVLIIIKCTG
jgi:hypothetical protein